MAVPVTIATSEAESIQTPLQIKTDDVTMEGIEDVDGVQDQVVAQVVRAEPPSPGKKYTRILVRKLKFLTYYRWNSQSCGNASRRQFNGDPSVTGRVR